MNDERDDEMTPELATGLRGLRRELAPSDLLEERVVRALRERALLRPRRIWERPLRWAAGIAAALVLFFSGLTLGQRTAAPRLAAHRSPAVSPTGPTPVVEQVRQTGAAYVRAVSDLQGASSIATRDQGHQAALDSLLEAAEELSRLQPNDPVLKLVLRVLKKGAGTEPDLSSASRQIFWV